MFPPVPSRGRVLGFGYLWLAAALAAPAQAQPVGLSALKPEDIALTLSDSTSFAFSRSLKAAPEPLKTLLRSTHKTVSDSVAKHRDHKPGPDRALALAELKVEKACLLFSRYRAGTMRDHMARAELEQAAKAVADVEAGRPLALPTQGLVESAFYSEIDGSPQPYCYYLPKREPPAEGYGMFVFLHGYVGHLDKVNWIDYMYSDKLNALAEEHGLIPMLPFGRSNTEFMGVGEVDVLEAIAAMRRFHKIDPRRIFLSGGSMGGSGNYTIACHYPHLVAGIAPIAGRYSYYLWKDIDRATYTGFKRIQTDIDYAEALPQSLRNVPAYIFHGGGDYLVKIGQSRGMSKLLRSLSQPVEYAEFTDGDHWIWGRCFSHPPFQAWLDSTRSPTAPRTVQYKTYTLKYDRAYWLRINDFERWGPPAVVTATASLAGAVTLTARNVADVTMTLGPEFVGARDKVDLVVNGAKHVLPIRSGQVRWQSRPTPAGALRKTHEICGPVREGYCSRFTMAFGTGGVSQQNLRPAMRAAHEWVDFAKGRAEIKADALLTDDDIKQGNLILFGDPSTSRVMREIAGKLPIGITPTEIVVGGRHFSRPQANLLMIYPNPLCPKRYVVINVGKLWGQYLSINHKLDHVPDFIVFTANRSSDGNNEFLCAGYFDENWRLREDLIWDAGKGNAGRVPVE